MVEVAGNVARDVGKARANRTAGVETVYLAGQWKGLEALFKGKGVTIFVL